MGGGRTGQLKERIRNRKDFCEIRASPVTAGLEQKPPSFPIMISKGIMDTSLERIRAKIAELEAKLADLRIAERELLALEKLPARKTRTVLGPKTKHKPQPSDQAEAHQTIGAAIADILGQHGALSSAEIADHIRATGRDINNRAVSFTLQALKKRGFVKSADGKWAPPKVRSRQTRT